MKFIKKYWKRIAVAFASVLVIGAGIGFFQIKRLGKITVPEFKRINATTYALSEGLNQSGVYLLLGKKDAILIDAANGLSNLPAGIKKITKLPVTVINTHGHYDHTRGNHYFDKVYLSEKDKQVYQKYNQKAFVSKLISSRTPPIIRFVMSEQTKTILSVPIKRDVLPLPKNKMFNFSGRKLEIVELPGHTPGSIGIIDDATKSMFVGDALTHSGYLLDLDESLSPKVQKESLLKIKALFKSGRITAAYGGHVTTPLTLKDVNNGLMMIDKIISGDLTAKEKESGEISHQGMTVMFKKHQ